MKYFKWTILLFASVGSLFLFQNCGGGFSSSSGQVVDNNNNGNNNAAATVAADISVFSSNLLSLVAGQSSQLNFKVTAATEVILNPGQVNVTGMTSYMVNPSVTTNYTLTASNSLGSVTKSLTIIVSEPLPVINSFSTSMASITSGGSSTLSWSVSNASQLMLDPGNVNLNGKTSLVVNPTATTIYTLKASNSSGGTVTQTITITVNAAPPPLPVITSFTSSAASIVSGQSATLNWVATGATSMKLDPGNITVTGTTSRVVNPTANTTYTLTATNVTGSVTKTVSIAVTQPVPLPVISSFTSSALVVATGESATLTWSATGAASLKIDPGAVDLAGKANLVVNPTANTTYTLTASNSTGTVTKTLSIVFIQPWVISPAPSFVASSGATTDLSLTLPQGIIKGGTFSVSTTGAPLPAGMSLSASGILSVGSAAVGDTAGVIFQYTEP